MNAVWADALLRSSVQGGVAGLLVWAIVRIFPRIPAATQVWLWRIVAIKFLLGLVLPFTIHRQNVPWTPVGGIAFTLTSAILALSSLGLLVGIVALLRDAYQAARITRGALLCEPEEFREIARRMGLWRKPRMMVKEDLAHPLVVGVLRPTILIPTGLGEAERRMALAHEMAHVRRRDLAYNWLIVVCEALFFFHPVVWLVRKELRLAQEIACDALAMRASQSSLKAYGQMLLSMTVSSSTRELALTAPMAGAYTALRERLLRLQRGERRLGYLRGALLAALALTILPTWRVQSVPLTTQLTPTESFPVAKRIGLSPSSTGAIASMEAQP